MTFIINMQADSRTRSGARWLAPARLASGKTRDYCGLPRQPLPRNRVEALERIWAIHRTRLTLGLLATEQAAGLGLAAWGANAASDSGDALLNHWSASAVDALGPHIFAFRRFATEDLLVAVDGIDGFLTAEEHAAVLWILLERGFWNATGQGHSNPSQSSHPTLAMSARAASALEEHATVH